MSKKTIITLTIHQLTESEAILKLKSIPMDVFSLLHEVKIETALVSPS